jgi:hypothetical protein
MNSACTIERDYRRNEMHCDARGQSAASTLSLHRPSIHIQPVFTRQIVFRTWPERAAELGRHATHTF